MPADDLILNLRQIGGYPFALNAAPNDMLVIQRGGLGGPYLSLAPSTLVATALSSGGDMTIAGRLDVWSVQGGALQFSNGSFGQLFSEKSCFTDADFQWATIQGVPVATNDYVDTSIAALANATVWSFNGRRGDIRLLLNDIECAGGAPINSPRFRGEPRAKTPAPWSNGTRLATTGFVHRNSVEYITNLLRDHPFVFTFNGRTGDVTLTPEDIGNVEGALLNSPALNGVPTAPTAPPGTDSTQLATTEFVAAAITAALAGEPGTLFAPLLSPNFTGMPQAPTANPGTSTAQLATTAFVQDAVASSVAGVATFNTRTGNVTLDAADITLAGGALLASPALTGTPTAPTAPAGSTSAQIATCAWVMNELGGANVGVMSFNGRDGAVTLNTTDITNAGGAPIVSPSLSGTPTAPTAATGTSTNQLATTAFVMAAITAGAGVTQFNGRTGSVTLTANDVSAAGALVNPSPSLTGSPLSTTPPAGDSSTRIATTAFVAQAITGASVVASFNGRIGAVSLTAADVAAAGGPYAPLAQNQNRNRLINAKFQINQRGYASGTALAAGAYGHDRWKAGSSGCTYTFGSGSPLTITAGSLQQVVEGANIDGGDYTLSWSGTAQGRVNSGAYGPSPLAVSGLPVNTNATVEFQGGTISQPQLELGYVATAFDWKTTGATLLDCQRYYVATYGATALVSNYAAAGAFLVQQNYMLPVMMRAPPTVSGQNYTSVTNLTGGSVTVGVDNRQVIAQAQSIAAGQCFMTVTWGNFTAEL